jgi:putative PIN family toxin of toxin-antitoxin system
MKMHRKLKITLDTNIIISALFWSGFPNAILRKCIKGEIELILSEEILEEIEDVLRKEKKFMMTEKAILEQKKELLNIARLVIPTRKLNVIKEDLKDNKILECGIAGKVDFIVSGDKHLLKIKKFKGIKIVTAREIVEMVERATP